MIEISNNEKLLAFFCYLGPLIIITLVVNKKSNFINAHLKQGLMFLLLTLAVSIISKIPIIKMLGWVFQILLGIILIVAIVNIFSGKEYVIPYFGDIAKKWKI